MIIDTSAIVAILRDEPEASECAKAIASTSSRRVSAVNYVEAAVVIDGSRNPVSSRRFDDLFREARHRAGYRGPGADCPKPTVISARAPATARGLISGTASHTLWPRRQVSRFCSRAMILSTRMSLPFSRERFRPRVHEL